MKYLSIKHSTASHMKRVPQDKDTPEFVHVSIVCRKNARNFDLLQQSESMAAQASGNYQDNHIDIQL